MKSITTALTIPLAAIVFALLARPWLATNGVHPAQGSLLAAAVAAAATYWVLTARHARAVASKAVFVGLLVGQTVLVPRSNSVASAVSFVVTVAILVLSLERIEQ